MPKPSATNIDSRYLITGLTLLTNSSAGALQESTATQAEDASAIQKQVMHWPKHDEQGLLWRGGVRSRHAHGRPPALLPKGLKSAVACLTTLMQVPQEHLGRGQRQEARRDQASDGPAVVLDKYLLIRSSGNSPQGLCAAAASGAIQTNMGRLSVVTSLEKMWCVCVAPISTAGAELARSF